MIAMPIPRGPYKFHLHLSRIKRTLLLRYPLLLTKDFVINPSHTKKTCGVQGHFVERECMSILKGTIYAKSAYIHPDFWLETLKKLKKVCTSEQFNVWIAPLKVDRLENSTLYLTVPNAFFSIYVRSNLDGSISECLESILGKKTSLEYVVNNNDQNFAMKPSEEEVKENKNNLPNLEQENTFSSIIQNNGLIKTYGRHIDTRYTFENFIVGSGNQFAYSAAKGVSLNLGKKHNPLLIYGDSGLGKTHLLHATAIEILKRNPSTKICYLPAEQFVNDFVKSTQKKDYDTFKSKYRSNINLFLMDDIQFFGNKDRSQEEFFYTFNHLYESKQQIIITSDKPPRDLIGIESRLLTRLQQGLVVDIKTPDLETRMAILKAKAEMDDLYLSEDVCLMIASNIKNNIRELEGALVRLEAEASIQETEITLDIAKEALSEMFDSNSGGDSVSINTIKQVVCKYFKIPLSDLESKSREKRIVEPRQIAMFLARKYASKTHSEIASTFGGKDHSTVIHATKKIEQAISTQGALKNKVKEIQQLL